MDRIDLALLGDCDKVIEWIKGELDEPKSGKLAMAHRCVSCIDRCELFQKKERHLSLDKSLMKSHIYGLWKELIWNTNGFVR